MNDRRQAVGHSLLLYQRTEEGRAGYDPHLYIAKLQVVTVWRIHIFHAEPDEVSTVPEKRKFWGIRFDGPAELCCDIFVHRPPRTVAQLGWPPSDKPALFSVPFADFMAMFGHPDGRSLLVNCPPHDLPTRSEFEVRIEKRVWHENILIQLLQVAPSPPSFGFERAPGVRRHVTYDLIQDSVLERPVPE
jgi:hypothetical protein